MQDLIFNHLVIAAQTAQNVPEGSILHFDKSLLIQMLIQGFNILLLVVVLIFILYKPVKKYMNNRTDRIKNNIESARLSDEKAQQLVKKYEKMIKNIEKEREEILQEAHRIAVEKGDHILLAARQEAKHLLKKAEDEIDKEWENASEDMKRQVIEISTMMASRFVEVSMDSQLHNKYIDEALTDWSEQ